MHQSGDVGRWPASGTLSGARRSAALGTNGGRTGMYTADHWSDRPCDRSHHGCDVPEVVLSERLKAAVD